MTNLKDMMLTPDFKAGHIQSLKIGGVERAFGSTPLFKIHMRSRQNEKRLFTSYGAKECLLNTDGATYTFEGTNLSVTVHLSEGEVGFEWRIEADATDKDWLIEAVDFPLVKLPPLADNNKDGSGGEILFPYNEGALISDNDRRCAAKWLSHVEPEYPSAGTYSIFPNMICSQMLAYVWSDAALYIGAHDPDRSVKQIDFFAEDEGIVMKLRLYSGKSFGESFRTEYPIIFAATEGRWEAAAECYRAWFESNLPPRVKKISQNPSVPEWYSDSPLVLAYPVRGIHDMDEMKPNRLFPYVNAMPLIKEIKEKTGSRILALLMHWEGTAPWAPPYVWPPYGGEECFNEFADALHDSKDLLGVYCSGFGYTINSNLLPYNNSEAFEKRGLQRAMCAGYDSVPVISRICTGQRSGYDICPASNLGRQILSEAYTPLFKSSIDYAQILDQNHGGGQYFCLSEKHSHAPTPGKWMTENMQRMLGEWNDAADGKVFGCESAASEAFIGNLLFNDNRFELNYEMGTPVPLYAYVYHEYIRNFMGNQVCCFFPTEVDTLRFRIGYSFAVGDSITLPLTPDGNLLSGWSTRDFVNLPDREKTLHFIKNLTAFYKTQAKPYLYNGKMIPAEKIVCPTVSYDVPRGYKATLPMVHSYAYEAEDGTRAQIFVNPFDDMIVCKVGERLVEVPALDATLIQLD